jgi:hypothetical protein
MKANELRIGNLVLDTKGNINVVDLEALTYMSKEPLNQVTPIILTEEWLFNFGFTQCENDLWYEKKIPNLNIMVSCNLNGRFCIEHKDNIVTIIDCCYNVHNFQNLYFALTGEELTIKQQ